MCAKPNDTYMYTVFLKLQFVIFLAYTVLVACSIQ